MRSSSLFKIVGWISVIFLIFSVYFASATNGKFSFPKNNPKFGTTAINSAQYYSLLSEAFLAGRLSLPIVPSKELLSLRNPYSIQARKAAKVDYQWDASLYNGDYFLYFGAVPALVFCIPYKLLFNQYPSDDFSIFCVALASVFLITAIFHNIRKLMPNNRFPLPIVALLAAFGCSFTLCLGGGIYSVAAFFAAFFLTLSIFYFVRIVTNGATFLSAFCMGLALTLAAGCRPVHFAYYLILPIWVLLQRKLLGHSEFSKLVLGCLPPLLLGTIALLIYNHQRFDSFFEFGLTYQLTLADYTESFLINLDLNQIFKRATLQAWFLLISPFSVVPEFPYLHFYRNNPWGLSGGANYVGLADNIVGVLMSCPILLPGAVSLIGKKVFLPVALRNLVLALFLPSLIPLLILLCARTAAGRFVLDFHVPWFIVATIGLLHWANSSNWNQGQIVRKSIIVISFTLTIIFGILAGFDGYIGKWNRWG